MFSRNVDFIAVLCITIGLLGFAQASRVALPIAVRPVGFERAIHTGEPCPVSRFFDFQR